MILRRTDSFETPAKTRRPWRHVLDGSAPVIPPRFQSGFDSLRGMDLFSPVSDGELMKFAALGCERFVDKGVLLPRADDVGPPLAMLLDGEAVLAWWHGDEELLLRELEPGDLLGEVEVFDALFADSRSVAVFGGASARTLTAVRLMEWDRDHVMEALRRWPDVALSLLGSMARRQRELQRRVAGICHQRAPRRLARALTGLVEDRGVRHRDPEHGPCLLVRCPPSRTRIAELAGMARETVSRLLVRWERCGWVAVRDGDLLVLDERQLRQLAGANA